MGHYIVANDTIILAFELVLSNIHLFQTLKLNWMTAKLFLDISDD